MKLSVEYQSQNVQQLRSFLGLLNYYSNFISNLADNIHPFYQLLHKGTNCKWTQACDQAFTANKEALTSSQVLIYYDPNSCRGFYGKGFIA